jgi:D-alanyl-D-alanine carboxypeptidase
MADRLDSAIAQAMADASIPGAMVGIWGPDGDYVRAFGVADKVTRAPMQTDFYTRIGSVTLPDYITEHIVIPLRLTHTSFPAAAEFPEPHAQGYTVLQSVERTATDWNFSWAWGAGNMISTLDDMRIWARALADGALLTPENQRQRLETIVPMNAERTAFYGLGLFNDGGWIGHSGVIFGYQTGVFYLPQTQTTLVFFTNSDHPHEAGTTLASAITSVISPNNVYG